MTIFSLWCTRFFLIFGFVRICWGEPFCSEKPEILRTPRIQLRAILIRCPLRTADNTYKNKGENPEVAISRSKEILEFHGFDFDEPMLHAEVVNCRRKLVITIKFSNCGKHKPESEYVVVDHAYDPATREKIRLLNAIVLKIKQDPAMQTYPLHVIHVVNGEATEHVINKHNKPDYTGCSTQPHNPTCGHAYYNGKPIPQSEGFCCSCDSYENIKRQPIPYNYPPANSDIAFSFESGMLPQPLSQIWKIGSVINTPKKVKQNRKKIVMDNLARKKRDLTRRKRIYPIFPRKYYLCPPMEPAKGFRRSDARVAQGKKDPWEAAVPACCYKKHYRTRKPHNAFHPLRKRYLSSGLQSEDVKPPEAIDTPSSRSQWLPAPVPSSSGIARKNASACTNETGLGVDADKRRREKRQVQESGLQVRGGQDCNDRGTPKGADPITYHESAHCLRFSDLWYLVYTVKDPFLSHKVKFQIFEKRCSQLFKQQWIMITGNYIYELGTFQRRVKDSDTSIVFSYTPLDVVNSDYTCLVPHLLHLLVPLPLPVEKLDDYPQPGEPAGHYIVLNPSEIAFDGDECNKAGVSYSAFSKQSDRCSKPKGSCLENQPIQFWKYDMAMKARGDKGKYFLENYADVPDDALIELSGKEYLLLHYRGQYSSVVELEYKADENGILRKESTVQISEVYVDSSCHYHTKITVLVTNTGLVSSMFRPRMTNCPVTIPSVWANKDGPLVVIPPQRRHVYRLSLYGPAPSQRYHCSIEILNSQRKIVAVRRIRIQKFDRCLCMWHCLCACGSNLENLKCRPMSLDHFRAAGFIGSMPDDTAELPVGHDQYMYWGKIISLIIPMHLFLLLFGLFKAIIGLCSKRIRLMYLSVVCPAAYNRLLEPRDSTLRKIGVMIHIFIYNVICFLVVPGIIFLYLAIVFIDGSFYCCTVIANIVEKKKLSRSHGKQKNNKADEDNDKGSKKDSQSKR